MNKDSEATRDAESNQGEQGYQLHDPRELAANFVRLLEQGANVARELAAKSNDGQAGAQIAVTDAGEAARALGSVAGQWARDPARMVEAQGRLFQGYAELWGRSVRRFLGEEVEPVVQPERGDPRFRDPDWNESPYFDFCKQAYLLTAQWAETLVEETEGIDEQTRQRADFYVRQLSSALSPSNFVLTNPEVMRHTLATNGENLVQGMAQLAQDLHESKGPLQIRQTDPEAFEVGRNLAITPGKVVFQNEIMQLIQYAPTTETVYEVPLLVVPPWINKYYILDLTPEKSFIAWAVDQGFTVFVVSWVNPDAKLAAKSFEDYMREGVLEALDTVQKATGREKVNALGYCVGGTLLAATLAYMAAVDDKRISSATFFAAQADFSRAGDLLVFIDEEQLTTLEEMMAEEGYLDGSRMATVFNMLRPRDLIWPYVVNNYLLGKKPFPFDLLYWNSDSTRMPAANHAFYLRQFYLENRLARGEMELGGQRLDLGKVGLPIYELATREDHIAPAESVLLGARLFGGPVRFVVAGSGHIAGVINPPQKNKYQHWISETLPPTLEEWLEKAEEHPGSWWPDWSHWLAGYSGERVKARKPGGGKLKIIEDAPGSYVKVRTG